MSIRVILLTVRVRRYYYACARLTCILYACQPIGERYTQRGPATCQVFFMKKVKSLLYLVALSRGVQIFLLKSGFCERNVGRSSYIRLEEVLEKVTLFQELNRDVGHCALTYKTKTPVKYTSINPVWPTLCRAQESFDHF